jgi:predicted GNAT family acetyltransferase
MSIEPGAIKHEKLAGRGRFSYEFPDGSEAELDYVEQRPGVVVITHTGTPHQHRGRGVAGKMVGRAIAEFRAAGLKVVPACSYAAVEFRRHPDWADLLAAR